MPLWLQDGATTTARERVWAGQQTHCNNYSKGARLGTRPTCRPHMQVSRQQPEANVGSFDRHDYYRIKRALSTSLQHQAGQWRTEPAAQRPPPSSCSFPCTAAAISCTAIRFHSAHVYGPPPRHALQPRVTCPGPQPAGRAFAFGRLYKGGGVQQGAGSGPTSMSCWRSG